MQAYEVTTQDELSLHVQRWNEIDQPDRTLVIIHGLGEHQGRYAHVAKHFADKGYQVFSFDQRGHGKSDGQRGHSPGIEFNLDDLERVIESIPHKNLYLYGHSFGGNLTANFILRKDVSSLRAVLLSGAWLRLFKEPAKTDVILAKIMTKIYPKFSQNNQLDTEDFSHIPGVGDDYKNDPLTHDRITASMFISSHQAGLWALEHAFKISSPTLLIHGADDHIIDPSGSVEFAKNAGDQASIRVFENTKHELHNDKVSAEMLDFVSQWFEEVTVKEAIVN